jgi:hypothetical protein
MKTASSNKLVPVRNPTGNFGMLYRHNGKESVLEKWKVKTLRCKQLADQF